MHIGNFRYNDFYKTALNHYKEGDYEEAIKYSKKGIEIGKEIGYIYFDKFLRIIGDSYAKLGKYDECVKWWPLNKVHGGDFLETIGYRFFKIKIFDMAEKYYRQYFISITQNNKHLNTSKIAHACSRLGEIFLFKNQPEIALSFLKTAEKLGSYSKRAFEKALQHSRGIEKRDVILDLVPREFLNENREIHKTKEVMMQHLLEKATKEAKGSFRKLDYRNRKWMHDSRYCWLLSTLIRKGIFLERKMVDRYWTNKDTSTLKNMLEEHRWEAWKYLVKATFLDRQTKLLIKKELINHDIEWNYISLSYIVYKMQQLNIPKPEPKIKNCKYCNSKFFEINSIGLFNWKYCHKCTLSAYRGAYKRIKSREEMIKDLRKLVEKLGFIPPKTYMKGGSPSTLLRTISKDKIEKIFPIMVEILPSEAYDLEFGSWLKALIESGVLRDDAREGTFGYMCLAKDGHECLSLAEKIIDDWLSDNQFSHIIEPYYPYDDELNPSGGLRADWQIDDILIEFFGLTGQSEYDEKTQIKIKLAKKHKVKLITIFPEDLYNLDKKLRILKPDPKINKIKEEEY